MMMFKGFFALQPHQGKEQAFVEALRAVGYHKSNYTRSPVRFALYSLDSGKGGVGWSPSVLELVERGVPLFLYPHAARPMVQYDGIIKVHPEVKCLFTHTEGGKRVMEAFDIGRPIEVVGWSFCEIKPFEPVKEVKNVVFGPIHPNNNGWLSKVYKDLNVATFKKIHAWCKKNGARLVVRYLHDLGENGLERREDSGVVYYRGSADQSTADIDQADLVVGHQTFAYLAVARGKPTLMMGENIPPSSGNCEELLGYVKNWSKYKDLLRFPLDILSGNDTDAVIRKAIKGSKPVADWRDLFIGKPFDAKLFVERLESYL